MPNASTRVCTVPVARMLALADEFLLLKAQIAAMQGRLEFVLTEIAMELELDAVSADNESQRPIPQHNGRSDDKPETMCDEIGRHITPQALAGGDHLAERAEIDNAIPPNEVQGTPIENLSKLGGKRETASLASPFPYNAIVLRTRHELTVAKSRLGSRGFNLRWAAATLVTAVTMAAAAVCSNVAMRSYAGAGSAFLPSNVTKQPSATGTH